MGPNNRMQRESGECDNGSSEPSLLNFALELLRQDVRPTAIIQDLRYSDGATVDDSNISETLFSNEAFKVLIRTQTVVWTDGIVQRMLDAGCPAEVVMEDSGVRLRVLEVGNKGKIRGVIALNYIATDTDGIKKVDYCRIMESQSHAGGENEQLSSTSAARSPGSLFTVEEGGRAPESGEILDEEEEFSEDDNSFPCTWIPKQFPHCLINRNLPPTQTPRSRQKSPATTQSPTQNSATPASTGRKSAPKQVGSIDPSKAIPPANMIKHLPPSTLPNWQAAADDLKRIGRGERWQSGVVEGEEMETELDKVRAAAERPLMDWMRPDFVPLPQYSAKHYESLRAIDWSKTSLGHPDTWDACLLSIASTTMTNAYPTAVYWGPEYTMFYNEHFVAIAQNRNPYILGKTFAAGWPELANYFIPILDKAYYRGETTVKQEELLPVVGRVSDVDEEESYFNFILCPVIGEHGRSVGVMEQAFEVTREVISARRMSFLRYLGETLGGVDFNVPGEFLRKVFQAFDTTPDVGVWNDTPFVGLYGLDDPEAGKCTLVGAMGLPERLASKTCSLLEVSPADKPHNLFMASMKEAMDTGETVLMKLDMEDSKDIQARGNGNLSRSAVVIPIQAAKGLIRGFLVLGVNPRRPFDDDYRFWIGLLKTELQSTSGREELLKAEVRKGIDAEIQRTERAHTVEVQRMLDTRTKELRDSELLFTKTAETIPVGLALVNLDGDLIFSNSAYHELTTLPTEENNPKNITWRDIVFPEDREYVYKIFDEAVSKASPARWEARIGLNYPERGWKYWVSCNMVVQTNEHTGELTGYMLTLADITQVKLAEEYQRQLSVQAVEKRRQQENFIDIFSHELRNPFSATLQCADGILAGVTDYQLKGDPLDLDDIADAASTILVCVQHQMRIINDVLTLSKLDSTLLSVVPVDVQIHESILTTLKIFQSELQVKGIKATFVMGDSYEQLAVDWLKCDPSRFNQILVNLLTNAIKFTSLQDDKREIEVTLDACTDRPMRNGNVVFACVKPTGEPSPSDGELEESDDDGKIEGEGWGDGEPLYVHVKVRDTGIGISEHWQKKLFNRFEQVPKTHVTYGGSGLGLFICRKLCRLQGGKIGVYSEEGKGSEFAFYIKTRRSVPPPGSPTARLPMKFQIISDNSSQECHPGAALPWSGAPAGEENKSTLDTNGTSLVAGTTIPHNILATFIPAGHITTPRGAAGRQALPALATRPHTAGATEKEVSSPPSLTPLPELFTPHSSASSAVQSTLKAFKPLKSPSIQPQPRPSREGVAYRVLIVEDNLINQEVLRRQLRKQECIVHAANNGQEALEFVEQSEFGRSGGTEVDIVLMDMEMPVMDGNTATRMIRSAEAEGRLRRHVPILGISANARGEQVAQMIKAGMDDAISKPFRIMDLVTKLGQLVERFGSPRVAKKPENTNEPASAQSTGGTNTPGIDITGLDRPHSTSATNIPSVDATGLDRPHTTIPINPPRGISSLNNMIASTRDNRTSPHGPCNFTPVTSPMIPLPPTPLNSRNVTPAPGDVLSPASSEAFDRACTHVGRTSRSRASSRAQSPLRRTEEMVVPVGGRELAK